MYYKEMITRIKNEKGKFIQKSNQPRQVRSLRLTDSAWTKLGELAEAQGITRGDFIENLVINHVLHGYNVTLKPVDAYKVQQLEIPIKSIEIFITQALLVKRLNVKAHLIAQSKGKSGDKALLSWSLAHDPDGIAWRYDSKTKKYTPAADLTSSQSSLLAEWLRVNQ